MTDTPTVRELIAHALVKLTEAQEDLERLKTVIAGQSRMIDDARAAIRTAKEEMRERCAARAAGWCGTDKLESLFRAERPGADAAMRLVRAEAKAIGEKIRALPLDEAKPW